MKASELKLDHHQGVTQELIEVPTHPPTSIFGSAGARMNSFTLHTVEFHTWADYLSFMERNLSAPQEYIGDDSPWAMQSDAHFSGDGAFNGVSKVTDAFALARNGWREGIQKVAQTEGEVKKIFTSDTLRASPTLDLVGDEVDIGLYLAGHPEHMMSMPERPAKGNAIDITVSVDQRCNACNRKWCDYSPVPARTLMLRGAIVASTANLLMNAGYQVNIGLTTVSWHNIRPPKSRRYEDQLMFRRDMLIPLYRPGEMWDYDRIVFGVCHQGLSRKLQFRSEEIFNIGIAKQYPEQYREIPAHRYSLVNSVGSLPRLLSHNEPNLSSFQGEFHMESGGHAYDAGLSLDLQPTAERIIAKLEDWGVTLT